MLTCSFLYHPGLLADFTLKLSDAIWTEPHLFIPQKFILIHIFLGQFKLALNCAWGKKPSQPCANTDGVIYSAKHMAANYFELNSQLFWIEQLWKIKQVMATNEITFTCLNLFIKLIFQKVIKQPGNFSEKTGRLVKFTTWFSVFMCVIMISLWLIVTWPIPSMISYLWNPSTASLMQIWWIFWCHMMSKTWVS